MEPKQYQYGEDVIINGQNLGQAKFDTKTGKALTPTTQPPNNQSQVITSEALKPVQPVNVPVAPVAPVDPVAPVAPTFTNEADRILQESEVEDTEAQQLGNKLSERIFSSLQNLTGEQQALGEAQKEAGVGQFKKQLQDINSQILKKQAELQQDDIRLIQSVQNLEQQKIPMEFITGQQQSVQRDAQIARALKASEIGILNASALATQGNIALAMETAQQAVDLKYAPYKEEIALYKSQLEALAPILSRDEKKQAREQELKANLALKDLDKRQKNDEALQNMLVTASSQNAPMDLLNRAKNAKTPSEAAMILGQYAGDFYKTELLKQSIETEKAQRAKIYADLAKTNAETNAANAFAELTTNQKIQANIASGKIQPGQLVSLSTGEIPKNISADKVDGLLALKDLAKKTKEYNDVFTRFEEEALFGGAGLATGLKNVPFPSGTKTALDGLRSEITDLLARARSGAALTAYETAEYEKKLPSSFNSSLGLGKQGTDKIKALQSSLDSTLNTKLQGYGVTFAEGVEDDYLDTVESSLKNLGTQGLNFSGYAASLTQ